MKRKLLSIIATIALISVVIIARPSKNYDIFEQNIEALSDGEGIFLRDCKMYMLWGGSYTIGYVCQPGTMSNYVLPCSYDGTGGVTGGKCYVQ